MSKGTRETLNIAIATTTMSQLITAVDIAESAGLSDSTVRRILADVYPKSEPRIRQKFDQSQMPQLVALCHSKMQRKRLNRFNAISKPVARN